MSLETPVAGQNVVFDHNTGLMWQQATPDSTYNWEDAVNYCDGLEYAGYSDWRLPDSKELLSILDNGKSNPAVDTTKFPNMPTGESNLWTSREYAEDSTKARALFPNYGWIRNRAKTESSNIMCVRGNGFPVSSFTIRTIAGQDVVTDSTTGLMWRYSYWSDVNWTAALESCETTNYAGYSDWRLPNKNELASLLNFDKSGKPYSDFPDMPSSRFWASTSVFDAAWDVRFDSGTIYYDSKTSSYNVRCVRNASDEPTAEEKCTALGGIWDPEAETCTKISNCIGLLPEYAEWNDDGKDGKYTQTYNYTENAWSAGIAKEYSEEAGICHFKCESGYLWNGTECALLPVCSSTSSTPCKDSEGVLIWSSKAPSMMNLSDADSHCDGLTEGGLSDWHLPTISELRTLIQNCEYTATNGSCGVKDSCLSSGSCWNTTCSICTANSTEGYYSKFSDTGWFWSSSETSDITNYAWRINFDFASVAEGSNTGELYVRCVRANN